GLVVRDMNNRREYPFGEATAHLVGTLKSVDLSTYREQPFDLPNLLVQNDPGRLNGYLPGDRMGESGVEAFLETRLKGVRGVKLADLGDNGQESDREMRRIDPVPGEDVRLTI